MLNQNEVHIQTTEITNETTYLFEFSICTLVTRKAEYQEMIQSFVRKGFTTKKCEYLFIDNSDKTTFEAYEGLNIFLQKAQGKYVILCHQDIVIHDSNYDNLIRCIQEIDSKDEAWGLLGNAGGLNLKWIGTHITEGKTGIVRTEKKLPLKTITLDENFIVVKKSANIALSNNLQGFHFYGTDICLVAKFLGFNSYLINFNVLHKSNGKKDRSFFEIETKIKKKYHQAFRGKYITTTFSRFYISGNLFGFWILNSKIMLFLMRQYYKVVTSKKDFWLK